MRRALGLQLICRSIYFNRNVCVCVCGVLCSQALEVDREAIDSWRVKATVPRLYGSRRKGQHGKSLQIYIPL